MAPGLALPYGFKDAKVVLLVQSIIGDFLQGEEHPEKHPHLQPVCTCPFKCKPNVNYTTLLCTGGLIFGWNALALMLKQQGNYNRNCTQPISGASTTAQSLHACLWLMLVLFYFHFACHVTVAAPS